MSKASIRVFTVVRRSTAPPRGISGRPHGTRRLGTIACWGLLLAVVALGALDARADLEAGNLVGRPAVAARGYTGAGVTVAIIDSGIQTSHPNLQGVAISEACFCTGGCCPNGLSTQFGPGAAADADPLEHGTISANLVASDNSAFFPVQPDSNPGPGMAPDVAILAIRIFPSGSVGTAFQDADLIAALAYIRDSQPAVDVVTMSLNTFARFPSACDSNLPAMRDVVNQLTAQGRVLVSITGNQADKSNIGAPACLENVIAVGATWDAPNLIDPLGVHPNGTLSMPFDTQVCTQTGTTDTVACFSNSSPELDLLAPGVKATVLFSAGNAFLDSAGTSDAAPIVAGCIAAMLQANPSLNAAGVRQILTASPTVLTDPANARTTPRLDCADAVTRAPEPAADALGLATLGAMMSLARRSS